MFKKLLIASAVLAVTSSVAFAAKYKENYKDEAPPAPCPTYTYMTGPYVGASLGSRNNYGGDPAVFRGVDLNVSAGYGMLLSPAFYLAGEAFALWTANVKDMTATDFSGNTVSAKSTYSWGLSLIPGYMLTEHVLGYVRLGGIRTRFNGTNVSDTEWGWQVGPGIQVPLDANWDMRAEYMVTRYGKVCTSGFNPNYSFNTASDVFNLGVVYKFV